MLSGEIALKTTIIIIIIALAVGMLLQTILSYINKQALMA